MFTIRREQVEVLQQSVRMNFEAYLFRRFRAAHHQQSAKWVREQVGEGLQIAIRLGIVTGRDVIRFVSLWLDNSQRAGDLLRNPGNWQRLSEPADPSLKIDLLEQMLLGS